MSASSVVVAPREIVDVVYRASRVAGADSGVASMLGRSACFAVGQLGSSLRHVVDALDAQHPPAFGFGTVTRAELATETDGALVPDEPLTVADLAYSAFAACRRGCSVSVVCGDGEQHAPHAWLSTGKGDLAAQQLVTRLEPVDQGLVGRVTSRHADALRHGLSVDAVIWSELHRHARGYLVSEALIDAAEGEPAK